MYLIELQRNRFADESFLKLAPRLIASRAPAVI